MCDWSHACASVLAISKWARPLFPGPFLHNCRGEFASKEGEYIRKIYISMLMHLCHSAFTLCALPRSRCPSVNFYPCGRLCDAEMCSTDAHICGPLKLVQFLFPYRKKWSGNMCPAMRASLRRPPGLVLGTFPHVFMCIYTMCKCMKYWITSTPEDQCLVMCINMHFVLPDV